MDFPKRIEQHKHESDSFAVILYKLKEIGIFRNITESDYGIDFEIEVVNGNQVEGHCVKVQIKSSDKLKVRKKDGHAIVGGIKQSTLYYWAELSYNIPVIAMAVDLGKENIYVSSELFWQAISLIDGTEKTKSIDFGGLRAVSANVVLIKKIAYGYGLRDKLNAHKWILRNLVSICSQYENAVSCDPWCTIGDVVFMRSFLDYSKTFLGIKSFPGDESIKKLNLYFDYAKLRNSTKAGEFDYDLQRKVMEVIFQMLMPLLKTYQNRVKNSAYYWAFKDPEYLKQVVTTDIPNENDGNGVVGNVRLFECHNCVVHAEDAQKVVLQGLDSYIVSEKNGQILVCKRSEEQRIREFASE